MHLHGKIVVIKRSGADGTEFPLTAACLFGRKPGCDIRIQLPQVSKEHCRIDLNENKEVMLTNLSLVNPTRINGDAMEQAQRLKHGDLITIIDRSFRFEYPPAPTPKKKRASLGRKSETLQVLHDPQVADPGSLITGENEKSSELTSDSSCLKDGTNTSNVQALAVEDCKDSEEESEQTAPEQGKPCDKQGRSPFGELYQMVKENLSVRPLRRPSEDAPLKTPLSRHEPQKPAPVQTGTEETGEAAPTPQVGLSSPLPKMAEEERRSSVACEEPMDITLPDSRFGGEATPKSTKRRGKVSSGLSLEESLVSTLPAEDQVEESSLPVATPSKAAPEESRPSLETPAEQSALEKGTPAKQSASVKGTPAKQSAPEKGTPAKQSAPVKETPAKQSAPEKETPAKQSAPEKETPAKQSAPEKETPAKQSAPEKETPAKQSVSEKGTPAKQSAPEKETPAKQSAPEKETPAKQSALEKEIPAKQSAPEKETPAKQSVSEKGTPAKQSAPEKGTPTPQKKSQPGTPREFCVSEVARSIVLENGVSEETFQSAEKSKTPKGKKSRRSTGPPSQNSAETPGTPSRPQPLDSLELEQAMCESEAGTSEAVQEETTAEAKEAASPRRVSPRKSPGKKRQASDVPPELELTPPPSGDNPTNAGTSTSSVKKRKHGKVESDLPDPQRKRKRVSFGGQLSPELFDKRLPPDSPLRRGATPGRRSLSVLRETVLRGSFLNGLTEDLGAESSSPKSATPKRSPGKKASPKKVSPAKSPKTKAKTPSPKKSEVKNSLGPKSPADTSSQGKRSPSTPDPVVPKGRKSRSPSTKTPKTPLSGKTPIKLSNGTPNMESLSTPTNTPSGPLLADAGSPSPTPVTSGPRGRSVSDVSMSPGQSAAEMPVTPLPLEEASGSTAKTPSPGIFFAECRSFDQLASVEGRFSVSRIITPSPVTDQGTGAAEVSPCVTPHVPLKRRSMKSTSKKTPKSARKSVLEVIRSRRSGASRANLKVVSSWADIVKFGVSKPQAATTAKIAKKSTRKATTVKKMLVKKPKTPAKKIKENFSTGHAASPATIVVGKAHKRVAQTAGCAPKVVHNIALLRKNMKIDEDLSGIAEIFRTPANVQKRVQDSDSSCPETPQANGASSIDFSVMDTPEEMGEMIVSPLNAVTTEKHGTNDNEAIAWLLQDQYTSLKGDDDAPQESDSSIVTEEPVLDPVLKRGTRTPKQKPESLMCLTGVKRIMKTPKQKVKPLEDLRGIKRLLKTPREPKVSQEVSLVGVKEIMKTPKIKTIPLVCTTGVKRLMKTPKQKLEHVEDLTGVKQLMKTPKQKGQPVGSHFGMKRLMKSPRQKVAVVEDFTGLQELMEEPSDFLPPGVSFKVCETSEEKLPGTRPSPELEQSVPVLGEVAFKEESIELMPEETPKPARQSRREMAPNDVPALECPTEIEKESAKNAEVAFKEESIELMPEETKSKAKKKPVSRRPQIQVGKSSGDDTNGEPASTQNDEEINCAGDDQNLPVEKPKRGRQTHQVAAPVTEEPIGSVAVAPQKVEESDNATSEERPSENVESIMEGGDEVKSSDVEMAEVPAPDPVPTAKGRRGNKTKEIPQDDTSTAPVRKTARGKRVALPVVADESNESNEKCIKTSPAPTEADTLETMPEPKEADTLETMPETKEADTLETMPEPKEADTLETMPEPKEADTLETMPEPKETDTLETMPEPKEADTLETMPEPKEADTLETMPEPKEADTLETMAEPKGADTLEMAEVPAPDPVPTAKGRRGKKTKEIPQDDTSTAPVRKTARGKKVALPVVADESNESNEKCIETSPAPTEADTLETMPEPKGADTLETMAEVPAPDPVPTAKGRRGKKTKEIPQDDTSTAPVRKTARGKKVALPVVADESNESHKKCIETSPAPTEADTLETMPEPKEADTLEKMPEPVPLMKPRRGRKPKPTAAQALESIMSDAEQSIGNCLPVSKAEVPVKSGRGRKAIVMEDQTPLTVLPKRGRRGAVDTSTLETVASPAPSLKAGRGRGRKAQDLDGTAEVTSAQADISMAESSTKVPKNVRGTRKRAEPSDAVALDVPTAPLDGVCSLDTSSNDLVKNRRGKGSSQKAGLLEANKNVETATSIKKVKLATAKKSVNFAPEIVASPSSEGGSQEIQLVASEESAAGLAEIGNDGGDESEVKLAPQTAPRRGRAGKKAVVQSIESTPVAEQQSTRKGRTQAVKPNPVKDDAPLAKRVTKRKLTPRDAEVTADNDPTGESVSLNSPSKKFRARATKVDEAKIEKLSKAKKGVAKKSGKENDKMEEETEPVVEIPKPARQSRRKMAQNDVPALDECPTEIKRESAKNAEVALKEESIELMPEETKRIAKKKPVSRRPQKQVGKISGDDTNDGDAASTQNGEEIICAGDDQDMPVEKPKRGRQARQKETEPIVETPKPARQSRRKMAPNDVKPVPALDECPTEIKKEIAKKTTTRGRPKTEKADCTSSEEAKPVRRTRRH